MRVRDARGGRHAGAAAASAPGCSRARARTSVRTNTSYNALKYPGPPESRSPRAHQRRLAASPAQLGASRSTIAPVPTVCSKLSTYLTRADSGMPNGWSEARRKHANGLQSTSERTRCGWLAVNSMTGSPDSDQAKTDAHLLPTASSTATSPSVQDCIAGRSWIGTASELPLPRRSVKIKRLNEASRCRWPATVGSSHSRSIGNGEGGTKRRSGPSPTIWYARWASPSRAYSVSGLAAMPRA